MAIRCDNDNRASPSGCYNSVRGVCDGRCRHSSETEMPRKWQRVVLLALVDREPRLLQCQSRGIRFGQYSSTLLQSLQDTLISADPWDKHTKAEIFFSAQRESIRADWAKARQHAGKVYNIWFELNDVRHWGSFQEIFFNSISKRYLSDQLKLTEGPTMSMPWLPA